MMTHAELCERARRWLKGSRRCHPVYSDNASCSEIPDAIGWSSHFSWCGSTVVECKVSVSDFYADKKKGIAFKHSSAPWTFSGRRFSKQFAEENGYEQIALPRMGDYRFYMSEVGVLSVEMIEKHAPDHGLLHVVGRRIAIVRMATRRTVVNDKAEIRYLRFAIINAKAPYDCEPLGALDVAKERCA